MTEKQINIEDLVQDDHNFNRGTEQGAKLIEKSFQDHGAGRSVLLDKDNRLIAGNKATKGAIAAGIKKVRIIETTGDELIAVKRTDVSLDSKEGREMAMLDNLTTQVNMSWDKVELETVAEQVQGFDVSQFGFDIDSLPQAQPASSGGGSGTKKEAKEDDFDDKKDEIHVRCKPGDIWQLGDHRLMCGDSTDLETVKTLMGGVLADMVFTDPPYGTTQLEWDKEPDLLAMFKCIEKSCKENAAILITGTQPFVTDLINANREKFKYELIWEKTQSTGFFDAKNRPMRVHEVISVFYSKQPTYNPQKIMKTDVSGIGRSRGNSSYMKTNGGHVGKVGREKAESYSYVEDGSRYPKDVIHFSNWNGALFGNTQNVVLHPTQKPVDLVAYLISTYSNEGDLLVDYFGGSGTTMIAAEQLGRKCFMMELDPHYCDVIINRWEKFTGKTATKVQP